MKKVSFLSENFQILEVKFSMYLNRRVFVMIFNIKTTPQIRSRFDSPKSGLNSGILRILKVNTLDRLSFIFYKESKYEVTSHYENSSIQIYRKFHPQNLKIF